MNILEVLARIAILVNALLIAITFDFIPSEVYKRRYGSDVGMTGYVDFMLGNHTFLRETSNTTETCRYLVGRGFRHFIFTEKLPNSN